MGKRTTNANGARTDRIKEGSHVRGIQSDDGQVRTLEVDKRNGGRLSVHTVDQKEPQDSTDLFHVDDVTSIKKA